MTDRPLIFSGPMVSRLLCEIQEPGTGKTKTRRVLSNDKPASLFNGTWADSYVLHPGNKSWRDREVRVVPGDRFWVREAHILLPPTAYRGSIGTGTIQQREHPTDRTMACVFREGFDRSGCPYWRSSRYMHRWASRITLLVTDVHVQRLHDIAEQDVIAEGLAKVSKDGKLWKFGLPDSDGLPGNDDHGWHWKDWSADPKQAFARLWNSLHGDAWGLNPWVAVYTFKPVLRNIDELEEGVSDD